MLVGFWVARTSAAKTLMSTAPVELPNKKEVILGEPKESRDEAEFVAEELIDSWN